MFGISIKKTKQNVMINFSLRLCVLLFSLLVSYHCSNQNKFEKNIVYEGYVYDSIGGSPSSGIIVSLAACVPHDGRNFCQTFAVGSSITDIAGHFKIDEKQARSGRYFLDCEGNHNMTTFPDIKNIVLYRRH